MDWKHDQLAADLAQHLRSNQRMVWTDMQLGPSGSPRPDVYTLEKAYSRPLPTAYECKISRSDLRSDTTSGKWQKYLAFAGAVIFAVPEGLCTVADIPAGCGLIVRKAQSWRHIRKATRSSISLPMDVCMKLLIDGVGRVEQRWEPRSRSLNLWEEHAEVRKKFGAAVAKAASDLASAQKDVAYFQDMQRAGYQRVDREVAAHRQYLMEQAKKEVSAYEEVKRELLEWLDLPADSGSHTIRRRVTELRQQCDADARVTATEDALARARSSVEHALRLLPERKAA